MPKKDYDSFKAKFKKGGEYDNIPEMEEIPIAFTKLRHDGLEAYYRSKYI